jgi:hypothetical protein
MDCKNNLNAYFDLNNVSSVQTTYEPATDPLGQTKIDQVILQLRAYYELAKVACAKNKDGRSLNREFKKIE